MQAWARGGGASPSPSGNSTQIFVFSIAHSQDLYLNIGCEGIPFTSHHITLTEFRTKVDATNVSHV